MLLLSSYNYPLAHGYSLEMLSVGDETGASQVVLVVRTHLPKQADVRDTGWIPGSGRSPGGGHSNPLQYSCLETPKDRGA